MTEERARLEAEVETLRLELTTVEQQKNESDGEIRRLNERITTLIDKQV